MKEAERTKSLASPVSGAPLGRRRAIQLAVRGSSLQGPMSMTSAPLKNQRCLAIVVTASLDVLDERQ